MGMAALFINFASTLNDLGIPAAIVQRPQIDQRVLSSLFWLNLLFSTTVTLVIIAIAPVAAVFFREPAVRAILQVLAFAFLIAGFGGVQHALFYREMNLRPPAMAQVISSVAALAVGVVMALKGMGVWSLVGSSLTGRAMDTVLMWVLHPWRPSFAMNWVDCRPVLRFGLNLSGFGIVNYFSRNADNLIIGRALGPASLGFYQNSYSLMYYPQQTLTSTTSNALLAALSKTQNDKSRFRQALLHLAAAFSFALFPLMLGMAVTADLIVRVVLGPQWGPAAPLLAILAVAGLLQSCSAPTGQIYVPTGNTSLLFRWSLVTSGTTVLGFLAGVHWGTIGVATAFAVVQILLLYPLLRVALRLIDLPVKSYLRALLPALWISLGMAVVVILWRLGMRAAGVSQPQFLLSSSVALGGLAYFALIWITRPAAVLDMLDVVGNSDVALLRAPVAWLRGKLS